MESGNIRAIREFGYSKKGRQHRHRSHPINSNDDENLRIHMRVELLPMEIVLVLITYSNTCKS